MVRNFYKKMKDYRDTGFGSRVELEHPNRMVNHDGSLNVKKTGLRFLDHFSVFHQLIIMSWLRFNVIVIISYLVITLFFSSIYWAIGVENLGVEPSPDNIEELLNSFYFSAQTFSTVGYGRINPLGHWINIVSVVEMLVGMMYLALAAGILFARFSRPVSKIVFSDNAVIAPYRDGTGLMFRMANAKENMLLNVEAQVLMAMEQEENGKKVRKFFELDLERKSINLFSLSWTVVHPIDKDSPIWKMSQEEFNKTNAEILVLVNGINDTFGQSIHSRTSYKHSEVVWGAKFESIFENRRGKTYVKINEIGRYKMMSDF